MESLQATGRDPGLHGCARVAVDPEASGSGAPTGQAHATAAVESCASLWSHAFAAARLEPEVSALDAFTLSRIARDLIVSGESLHVIEVEGGELKLLPVGDHDVRARVPIRTRGSTGARSTGRTPARPARSRRPGSSIYATPSIRRARGAAWDRSNGPGWMRTC